MLQFIFLSPIIYFIIKKYDFFGTIICFLVTALWELIQYCWEMNGQPYKYIIFRYISIIGFGCYIAVGKTKLSKFILLLMFAVGVVWQTLLNYRPLHPVFMNEGWARVNYISSLFVMPILYIVIKKYYDRKINIAILEGIGKASYNIYLVQMLFYGYFPAQIVYRLVDVAWIQLLICITVCIGTGFIFYKIESKITNRIIRFVRQKNYFKKDVLKIIDYCNQFVEE